MSDNISEKRFFQKSPISDNFDETRWLKKLEIYLRKLLSPIISPDDMNYYFTPDQLLIWATAFTHETYSPSDNNEDLEYGGDKVLHYVFPKYLRKRFPSLHKKEYTELNTRYMSAIMQADLARKMGLSADNRIRTKGLNRVTLNLEGDMFEAFFGALEVVSDNVYEGFGASNCLSMIALLFKDIDINDAESHAKTQVVQIFVRFELPKPLEYSNNGKQIRVNFTDDMLDALKNNGVNLDQLLLETFSSEEAKVNKQIVDILVELNMIEIEEIGRKENTKEKVLFTVSLSNKHIDFLSKYGIHLKSKEIGRGEAPTKKEAEFKAYSNALSLLGSLRSDYAPEGITTTWAEETKLLTDLSYPEVKQYIRDASTKLSLQGFSSFYFAIPRKTSDNKGAVVQLVGVRSNGKHEVLSYTYTPKTERQNGYRNAKALVMKQYVED